jgi:hypothetical protein
MGDSLSYNEWLKAKRAYRASLTERDRLENRVRRLRDEERAMQALIANAREKGAFVDEARDENSNRRASRKQRADATAHERIEQHDRVQSAKIARSQALETARASVAESRARTRNIVKRSETLREDSCSARRTDEKAQLAQRCALIRRMQQESQAQRRAFLDDRRADLQRTNARHGSHITLDRAANIKASSELMIVEAEMLRHLVELRREAKLEAANLADKLHGRQSRPLPPDEQHAGAFL